MLHFDLISLFPDFFTSPLQSGLLAKAIAKGIVDVNIVNPRNFTDNRHHKVDDEPYGGGVGMVIKPEPIFAAFESLPTAPRRQVILMSPQGEKMSQPLFKEWATNFDRLVLICGHYEGVDERVMHIVDREISLGDFVLTCGEIPALTMINGITRLLPGTVAKPASIAEDSFEDGLLDYPHYTRPPEFRGWEVPAVLRSGHHDRIATWRREQQIDRTKTKRPDLYQLWQNDRQGKPRSVAPE
jgi:tRNA (guanine37-N1)-methyltransferase